MGRTRLQTDSPFFSAGKNQEVLAVWEETRKRHPDDRGKLFLPAILHGDQGNPTKAKRYSEQLPAVAPKDPGAVQLLEVPQFPK